MRTPLYDEHIKAGGKIVDFHGFELPLQFSSIREEHLAVRSNVGIFDVSHMGDFFLEGPGAAATLDWVTTAKASSLKVGSAKYAHFLDDEGKIIDDTIFYRLAEDRFLLVPNAAMIDTDLALLKENAKGDVTITNRSEMASIAVQGPMSEECLVKAMGEETSGIKRFKVKEVNYGSGKAIVSHTGYTGEKGFEVNLEAKDGPGLWRKLLEAGAVPCGLGARDSLRMEKGFLLSGQDFSRDVTPIEASCEWIINWKHEFRGRSALEAQREKGVEKKFIGFIMKEKKIPRHGFTVHTKDGEEVGVVTSGTLSYSLDKPIALGYVKTGLAEDGTVLYIKIRGKLWEAEVKRPPLV